MHITHLNCGAMQPFGGAGFDGLTPGVAPAELSCHCLLLQHNDRLMLVDTGAVSTDPAADARRHSAFFLAIDRIRLNPVEAAARQIQALGHSVDDVSDIVMTHLDFDHAAGLVDFPNARIHLAKAEADAAVHPSGPINQARYRLDQFRDSMKRWRTYSTFEQNWFGLAAEPIADWDDVFLVELPGHTPGHCGVAIKTEGGWLLHAADAIFNHRELDQNEPSTPTLARFYQWMMQTSQRQRRQSLRALRRITRDHAHEIQIICTHDPVWFD